MGRDAAPASGADGEIRVLLALDGLWLGGTERSLVEMLPGLAAAGIAPTLVCFRRYRGEEGLEREVPAELVSYLDAKGFVAQVHRLRTLLRERRPHVLHTSLFHANLVGRTAAAGLPVAVLNSLVNTTYSSVRFADPNLSRWRLRAAQVVDAVSGRLLADHFHAVSHTVAAAARDHLRIPPRSVTVIERGRDPERLGAPSEERRCAARRELGLGPDQQVVVTVGSHEYQKGQEHLVRAVARLAAERPGIALLVAGRRGAVSERLAALVEGLGLAGGVRLLGHRADVPEVLAAGDVFALPSLYEGYPGALLEAMALALPVVASDIPPVREIVEPDRSALLVPPADDRALAEALRRLLDDRELAASTGRRGRELFLERHTVDRSVREMAALYRLAAGNPR